MSSIILLTSHANVQKLENYEDAFSSTEYILMSVTGSNLQLNDIMLLVLKILHQSANN